MLQDFFQHCLRRAFPLLPLTVLALSWVSSAHAVPVPGQGTWETTLHARDIDHDGVTDAYYDGALNITWLANASPLGVASWEDTNAWIAAYSIGGFSDWRLPFMPGPVNGRFWNREFSWDGSTDNSYNNSRTEMGHLFYLTLGNLAPCGPGSDPNIPHDCINQWPNGRPEMNTGPFEGLHLGPSDYSYWANSPIGYGGIDSNGYQFVCVFCDNTISLGAHFVVVRNGDVQASAVPEPDTLAMALVGSLAAVTVSARRRRTAGS